MKFTHAIADQLEQTYPVKVIQWGVHQAPAVVVQSTVDEDEETKVIHAAASWLREHGFVDIRFETGHGEYEDQPVLVMRHPWDEGSEELVDYDPDAIVAMVRDGNIDDALAALKGNKVAASPYAALPLHDLGAKLTEGMDLFGDALTCLDEAIYALGEHDANRKLGEEASALSHQLTEQIDEVSSLAAKLQTEVARLHELL
jgi:hypothetical protein